MRFLAFYVFIINIISMVITVYDKLAARNRLRRIRERTLFILSAVGGAVGIYVTMLLIRHKTLHKKFMIGLPLIITLHVILFAAAAFYGALPV